MLPALHHGLDSTREGGFSPALVGLNTESPYNAHQHPCPPSPPMYDHSSRNTSGIK